MRVHPGAAHIKSKLATYLLPALYLRPSLQQPFLHHFHNHMLMPSPDNTQLFGCFPGKINQPISGKWPPVVNSYINKSPIIRSEEHTSELQSLMRISYAVFCLKKKKKKI